MCRTVCLRLLLAVCLLSTAAAFPRSLFHSRAKQSHQHVRTTTSLEEIDDRLIWRSPENILHFFWAGPRTPSDSAVANLKEWAHAAVANRRGDEFHFDVYLWHDPAVCVAMSSCFSRRKRCWVEEYPDLVEELREEGIIIQEIIPEDHIHPSLSEYYVALLNSMNFPGASDLFRYSILHSMGGTYIDVDMRVGPILINLNSLTKWKYAVPRVCPGLRDMSSVQRAHSKYRIDKEIQEQIHQIEEEHEEHIDGSGRESIRRDVERNPPPEPEHYGFDEILEAANYQMQRQEINNGFISISSRAPFMNRLIDELANKLATDVPKGLLTGGTFCCFKTQPSTLGEYICDKKFHKFTADITGPNLLKPAMYDFIWKAVDRDRDRAIDNFVDMQMSDTTVDARPSVLPIQWVTDDSENQTQ